MSRAPDALMKVKLGDLDEVAPCWDEFTIADSGHPSRRGFGGAGRRPAVGPALVSVVHASSAVATVPPVTPDPASMGTNPFIPEDANIGDCISAAPRPDCGSDQRSGYHQYVTFIILFLATVFIGWRVALGVRARDRVVNDVPEKAERPTKV